jgi:hypothetical protein
LNQFESWNWCTHTDHEPESLRDYVDILCYLITISVTI